MKDNNKSRKFKALALSLTLGLGLLNFNINSETLPLFIKNYKISTNSNSYNLIKDLLVKKPQQKTSSFYSTLKRWSVFGATGVASFIGIKSLKKEYNLNFLNNKIASGISLLPAFIGYKFILERDKNKHENKILLNLIKNWDDYKNLITDPYINKYFNQLHEIYRKNPKFIIHNSSEIANELKSSILELDQDFFKNLFNFDRKTFNTITRINFDIAKIIEQIGKIINKLQ